MTLAKEIIVPARANQARKALEDRFGESDVSVTGAKALRVGDVKTDLSAVTFRGVNEDNLERFQTELASVFPDTQPHHNFKSGTSA